jgi:hypothetical protein
MLDRRVESCGVKHTYHIYQFQYYHMQIVSEHPRNPDLLAQKDAPSVIRAAEIRRVTEKSFTFSCKLAYSPIPNSPLLRHHTH